MMTDGEVPVLAVGLPKFYRGFLAGNSPGPNGATATLFQDVLANSPNDGNWVVDRRLRSHAAPVISAMMGARVGENRDDLVSPPGRSLRLKVSALPYRISCGGATVWLGLDSRQMALAAP